MGFGITFCPYTEMQFWVDALVALNTSDPGAVKWWNLQCYSSDGVNDPTAWAAAITQAIPGFPIEGYILAGGWSRGLDCNLDGSPKHWNGDCPAAVQQLMSGFKRELCVGGGFLWALDEIIGYDCNNDHEQDPNYCAEAASLGRYLAAISNGLTQPTEP